MLFGQQYQFLEYSVPEGLAQSQVTSIVQDQKGYLWIGTQGGLSKFDGIEFKSFSTNDGLVGNSITKICFDTYNRLWISANGGVSMMNEDGGFENFTFSDKFAGTSVSDLVYFKGQLLISTNGSGLFYLKENTIIKYPNQEGLNPKIRAMFDYQNKLLFGTKDGVKYLDQGKFKSFHKDLDSISISSFAKKNDSLAIGTYGKGVGLFYKDSLTFLSYKASGFNRIRKVFIGKEGEIWTSSKYGVLKYFRNEISAFTEAEGLPTRNVYCIYSDSENNIWFGTSGNGLQKLASFSFLSYSDKSGMLSNKVMAISKDYKGNYWYGTIDRGLTLYDGQSFNNFEDVAEVDKRTIRDFVSEKDRLLIGTSNGVVTVKYDKNNQPKFYRETEFQDLRFKRITVMYPKSDKEYWIANMDELWIINADSSVLLDPEVYGYSGQIRDIKENADGQLYIATTTGLYVYSNDRFNFIELKNNENNEVNCIAFDPEGKMVLGSSNGLFFNKSGTFQRLNLGTQFNENILNFVEFDGNGNLYAGTNNGLFVIKQSDRGYENEKPFRFSIAHGLNSVETNLGSSFVDDNKTVWFGTIGGVVRQKENVELFKLEETPKIQLLDITLFFETKNWKKAGFLLDENAMPKDLVLGYKENHVTFNFIGLFFKDPGNVVYQYRLRGINDEWSPKSKQSNVTFPELSYGEYTFDVRAKYGDGEWSSPKSYSFRINAPFRSYKLTSEMGTSDSM